MIDVLILIAIGGLLLIGLLLLWNATTDAWREWRR